MSHLFNLKYDEMKGNMPVEDGEVKSIIKDESPSRNICFEIKTGNKMFFNYGYLLTGQYNLTDNKIILTFTSHHVYLEGVNLESLFNDLMNHTPKQICAIDSRYNGLETSEACVVNNIIIVDKE